MLYLTKTKETFWLGSTQCYYNSIVLSQAKMKMKWNESGFRPPLCTYELNWARRTSWGWWDDWDDTALQIQDSKFEPWRSEAEHATSRSRRLPTILTFTRGWGINIFVSFEPPRPGTEPRTLAWKAAVLTTTLGPPPSPRCKGFAICTTQAFDTCLYEMYTYTCTLLWFLVIALYDENKGDILAWLNTIVLSQAKMSPLLILLPIIRCYLGAWQSVSL